MLVSALLQHQSTQYSRVIGCVLLVGSSPLVVLPFLTLKRHGGVGAGRPYFETTALVTRGPYRLVRHPQYLGYTLFVLGFALITLQPAALALSVAGGALFYLQAVAEERQCISLFGDQYRRYKEEVPRFNIILGVVRVARNRA